MLTPNWRGELTKQPDTGEAAKQNLTYADVPDTDHKRGHYTWGWAQDKTPYMALTQVRTLYLAMSIREDTLFISHWAQENSLSRNEHKIDRWWAQQKALYLVEHYIWHCTWEDTIYLTLGKGHYIPDIKQYTRQWAHGQTPFNIEPQGRNLHIWYWTCDE